MAFIPMNEQTYSFRCTLVTEATKNLPPSSRQGIYIVARNKQEALEELRRRYPEHKTGFTVN